MTPNAIPRALATIVLLVSLAMVVPLGVSIVRLMRGVPVPSSAWTIPLLILATGFVLLSFLPRMQALGTQLYLSAFALWILAAGYFLFAV